MKKLLSWLLKFLSSRFFFLLVILLLQIFVLMRGVRYIAQFPAFTYVIEVINVILTIYVVNRDTNTSYKLAWILLIFAIPVVGSIIYLMFAERRVPKNLRAEMMRNLSETDHLLPQDEEVEKQMEDQEYGQTFNYVRRSSFFPYYRNTDCFYFDDGEKYFLDLMEKIEHARHFIFLEFFIVKDGVMLEKLIAALRRKVAEGVEVYFLYDDGGSITTLSRDYSKVLGDYGIHCAAFNPLKISMTLLSKTSNRDHRKICVIDNQFGYMGGLNIGDEYINKQVRFGHWKDSAIRLEGEAVKSLTVMFIQFFNAAAERDLKYDHFLIEQNAPKRDNYILPFSDSPTDDDDVGRNVHFNMISRAKKYIYISTPYLILDHDMSTALKVAAKCGVEVIITVPHIPDKKTVFMVTRSNYIPLLKAGVKIYEYTPGFIHSKTVVSDDEIALVGTINMDYRSYYLHYECGTLVANDEVIQAVKKDYLETLAVSEEITLEKAMQTNVIVRIARSVINVFSPLF